MRHAALAFLLAAACADQVTGDDWKRMTLEEKLLYVNSLAGAEKARERKGGNDRVVTAEPAEIVARIDAAYADDDARTPEEIFSTLAERRDSQRLPRPASP